MLKFVSLSLISSRNFKFDPRFCLEDKIKTLVSIQNSGIQMATSECEPWDSLKLPEAN